MAVPHVHADRIPAENDDPLFVSAVTQDVAARVALVRQLSGEAVLLLFPDHATAARTLGNHQRGADLSPGPDSAGGSAASPAQAISYGGLLIDPLRLDVTWHGTALRLTRLERAVLARLAEPPLRVWPYEMLYRAAWGDTWLGDTSALHATVKRLRRKLRDAGVTLLVESVRGIGFRLNESRPARLSESGPARFRAGPH